MTRKLSIRLHESKKQEAESLFLPQSLKNEIGDFLPSCYTAHALAVFKGTEDFDSEAAVDVEYLSLDVDRATVKDNYLMVAFKDRPSREEVEKVMQEEYKKAVLPSAPALVAFVDVESIRDALQQIAADSNGKDWELFGSLSDINDLADIPGVVDAWYSPDAEVCLSASVFTFNVAENIDGKEIKETTSVEEAEQWTIEMYNKYKVEEGVAEARKSNLPIGKRTEYFPYKFYGEDYNIAVRLEQYQVTGGIALIAETDDGEPWTDVSVCLPGYSLDTDEFFASSSMDGSLLKKLSELGIVKPSGEKVSYNLGTYEICSADLSKFTEK